MHLASLSAPASISSRAQSVRPNKAASISAVHPPCQLHNASIPIIINTRLHLKTHLHRKCQTVESSKPFADCRTLPLASLSAPASMSSRTQSARPSQAATISADSKPCELHHTSMPIIFNTRLHSETHLRRKCQTAESSKPFSPLSHFVFSLLVGSSID